MSSPGMDHVDRVVRDPARLAALRATGLLDTPPEPAFDRLTRLAARLLRVPATFLSLVDEERDFYKAATGLPEPVATTRELTGRTFCHHTVADSSPGQPLVISDARGHPVYGHVPTVESLGVAAYLGVPLVVEGQRVGALCAIDVVPRDWTAAEVEVLGELAASAQREVELRMALEASRRTAEALERSNRERQEFLNATPDGVYTIDREGRIVFANRAAGLLLGYAPEEMVGREAHALFHHSHPDGTPFPREECPLVEAANGGRGLHVQGHVVWRRDGSPVPVDFATSPLERDGRVIGALVRFADVTEQKRAVEALQLLAESGRALSSSLEVEETLHAIAGVAVPQMAEMVMVDVLEGGEFQRVAACHCETEREAELFERARRFPPLPGDGGPQARVIESGRSLLLNGLDEAWIQTLNRGREHAALVRELSLGSVLVAPLETGGQILGTVAFVRGARRAPFEEADRGLAEELGRRAALAVENARLYASARNATRARDDMLGVVSHDLRNPIHTVFMGASFLLDLLPEAMKVERTQAAIIRRAAERGNRLIQDLLDITQIESGRLTLQRERHSSASVAREAAEQAAMAAADKGVALGCGAMEDAPVWMDRDRVLQAIGNLVGNALKFTPSGGKVTVEVRRGGDGTSCFVVADTGPGIAPELVPHLFRRYWQADGADRRGVGLGLSIVKGIAEAHGGSIGVDTVPGEGTTFTLVLPTAPDAPGEAGGAPS